MCRAWHCPRHTEVVPCPPTAWMEKGVKMEPGQGELETRPVLCGAYIRVVQRPVWECRGQETRS